MCRFSLSSALAWALGFALALSSTRAQAQALPSIPLKDRQSRPWAASVSARDQAIARELYGAGNQEFVESRYAPALKKYREAITHWDHPAIRFNMAVALINLERPVEASDNDVSSAHPDVSAPSADVSSADPDVSAPDTSPVRPRGYRLRLLFFFLALLDFVPAGLLTAAFLPAVVGGASALASSASSAASSSALSASSSSSSAAASAPAAAGLLA
jgi:hypothetical protein